MKNKKSYIESVPENIGEVYKTCKENCGTGTERLFTQRELEKCIGERLTRERRKAAPLEKLKEVLERLIKGGMIDADSYAEAAEVLCKKLEESSSEAGNTGEGDFGGEAVEITGAEVEDFSVAEASGVSDVYEYTPKKQNAGDCEVQYDDLKRSYPYIDGEALMADRGFKVFCRGREGSLAELYQGYAELVRELGAAKSAAVTGRGDGDNADNTDNGRYSVRELSSTAFSAGSASPAADTGTGLSPLQRDIARRAGISYREYAQMLRDIPKAGKGKGTSGGFSMR